MNISTLRLAEENKEIKVIILNNLLYFKCTDSRRYRCIGMFAAPGNRRQAGQEIKIIRIYGKIPDVQILDLSFGR